MLAYDDYTAREVEISESSFIAALEVMLSLRSPCSSCPAMMLKVCCSDETDEINVFCKKLVGLEPTDLCPCYQLGKEEAIRRATEVVNNYREGKEI